MATAMLCATGSSAFGDDLSERINALEIIVKSQAKIIEEQQKAIDQLKEETARMAHGGGLPEKREPASPPQDIQKKVDDLNEKVEQVAEAQKREISSIFNPAIGLVGETVFSYRSKGQQDTGSARAGGFDVYQRSVELNAAGSVDPFCKAYVVANASADATTGESMFGIEEAAIQTTALPWNLEVKAGRFFGEFGRLAYIHDHELPFVNRPLALAEYIGGESRTDGLQVNWLLPAEHYVSWTAGTGVQFGGDNPPNNVGTFRHASGMNYWTRLSTSFDLTPDVSLEPGASGLWNPHTDSQSITNNTLLADAAGNPQDVAGNIYTERARRLYGADFVLSYKPLRNNQFQSVTWGTEVLYSENRYDMASAAGTALPGGTVGSVGLYSYLTYKFHRQWSAGFLYEWVESQVDSRDKTSAYSPYLTWATSHWNQLRFQYTHTSHNAYSPFKSDDAVYGQWAWIIGAHSHGWQQR
jgi:hypothetical protein